MFFCQHRVIFLQPFKDIFPHLEQQRVNMTHHRSIARTLTFSLLVVLSLFFGNTAKAQDGKSLFLKNCASCHDPKFSKDMTGPNLLGVGDRWPDKAKLKAWIKNSQGFLKTGDKYANDLYVKYEKRVMNTFEGSLSDAEIDGLIKYITTYTPPPPPPPGSTENGQTAAEGDNSLLFGILTLILAVVALTLLQVNSNLKKLSDDKAGVPATEPVPFWRNKAYISVLIVVLFLVGGYFTTKGAIGLGRNNDYQPEQPIYFSHKIHAGVNQINCQYCHVGVYQGKQATIPSVNICMNCHMAIGEYAGKEKIYKEDGSEVNGTAEIQKLYEYAGFTAGKSWDATKAKPVKWTRIHNLPDHVYFNHQQHVVAGKQQCQTCHGNIPGMDEVKQFSDLSMGWCINCHRETQVQFKDNGYYSIYEKYHEQLKSGKLDSTKGITVEKIGGTECQKCHY